MPLPSVHLCLCCCCCCCRLSTDAWLLQVVVGGDSCCLASPCTATHSWWAADQQQLAIVVHVCHGSTPPAAGRRCPLHGAVLLPMPAQQHQLCCCHVWHQNQHQQLLHCCRCISPASRKRQAVGPRLARILWEDGSMDSHLSGAQCGNQSCGGMQQLLGVQYFVTSG